VPCGCQGAARGRTGRALRTSGDAAPLPEVVAPALAKYVVKSADGDRHYATYREAALGQATHGGRLRTAR
jgi:hypothetical protein